MSESNFDLDLEDTTDNGSFLDDSVADPNYSGINVVVLEVKLLKYFQIPTISSPTLSGARAAAASLKTRRWWWSSPTPWLSSLMVNQAKSITFQIKCLIFRLLPV